MPGNTPVSQQTYMSLRLADDEFDRIDALVAKENERGAARASRQSIVAALVRKALKDAERAR